MLHKKSILVITVLLLVAIGAWAWASNGLVDQIGVLSGKVKGDSLVTVGAHVREGAVLVMVDNIAGPAAAVRATGDGIVREVLVKPGDMIHSGDVLVRIEAVHK
jgi:acetyl/propionyl-CoA carboxylase alpha subunit